MRLNNRHLYDFLTKKEILSLYHANTVSTSLTYLQQNGLLSRGAVESMGLFQSFQKSDAVDKILNVWNDIFLDTTDLHSFFSRQNLYGPALFELDTRLVLNEDFNIWITKNNPIYWNLDFSDNQRYFETVEELDENWDNYNRQKMMVTIRNNSTPILFEYVRRVIVDDPRVNISGDAQEQEICIFNEVVKKINETVNDNHALKGKFKVRKCNQSWCRDNYLHQVDTADLKRLFL